MLPKNNLRRNISSEFGNLSVFDEIYKSGLWGKGSGGGSDSGACIQYSRWLEKFIIENEIRSIVDLGCGDWQFMRLVDLNGAKYLGIDVASSVIDVNSRLYSSPNVQFGMLRSYKSLPSADLLICKDVMQHLSNQEVFRIIEILPRYTYSLVTNDVSCGFSAKHQLLQRARKPWAPLLNRDIQTGDYRTIDISKKPFNTDSRLVLEWKVNPYSIRRRLHPKNLLLGFGCESIKRTYLTRGS